MKEIGQLVLIALGSNDISVWGDPGETVQKAISAIEKLSQVTPKYSQFYQTPAFPAGAGPDFVNAAVAIHTILSSGDIMHALHAIEQEAGRERVVRWGQRTLDLDLIAYGSDVSPDVATHTLWRELPAEAQAYEAPKELILPHPRVQDRSFVLVPLADVAPNWRHPVLGQTVVEMLAARPSDERATVVPVR